MEKQNNHIDRRGFLKIVGISAATTTAALYGCGSGTKSSQGRNASSPVPTDQMTYRSVGGIKIKYPSWDMAVCVGLPFLHRKEKETLSIRKLSTNW